jgi:3-dehydroquinate synthase
MPTVPLHLPHHHYDIRIEPGSLVHLGELVRQVAPHSHAALIVDHAIAESHGRVAARAMTAAHFDTQVAVLPSGEDHKTLGAVRSLYEVLLEARLERKSPIVALGGGITGDTVGFVAATYLRGVPFIQCPTTLLAMVDASVGGKVGVNVPQGKNLIGAFYQPQLVVIDTETLRTLPDREIRCGLAECVKHAVLRDPNLFNWIESHLHDLLKLDTATMVELVERNVRIKAAVVMEDEKEASVRAHLNFGHTFAHAIEAGTKYGTYHHGEAVALGMIAATSLAVQAKRCEASLLTCLTDLLEAIGLPTRAANLPATDELIDLMRSDKKVASGRIRLVLPDRLGQVTIVSDTPDAAIASAWDRLRGG